MANKEPDDDWWYTDLPEPHMREVKPLDASPVRKRYPPDFRIAVDGERRLRRQLIIWRSTALVGVGYMGADLIRAIIGWF